MKTRVVVGVLGGLALLVSVPASGRAEPGSQGQASFAQLREHPQAYLGATVVLGGEIIRWTPSTQGFLLQVLQHPFGPNLRPESLALSGGWFWVEYPEQLGPLSPLTPLLSVVGEVVGAKEGYPVIRAQHVSVFSLLW